MNSVHPTLVRVLTLVAAAAALTSGAAAHAWDGPLCAFDVAVATALPARRPPAPLMCPPAGDAVDPPPVVEQGPIDMATAREALSRARELGARGRVAEAVLQLEVVSAAYPRIADRIALMRGNLLLAADEPQQALRAFEEARRSPDSTVGALARVGRVRALIRSDHRDAATALTRLLRYYPRLPESLNLRLDLAEEKERLGDLRGAVRTYRDIDLNYPGSPAGERARARLRAMRDRGLHVRPLRLAQRIERAQRLVRQGPPDLARPELDALLRERLTLEERGRVTRAAARIARIEGRWDDARRYLRTGRGGPLPADPAERERLLAQRRDTVDAATAREQEVARRRIAQLKGRVRWDRVQHARLLAVVQMAARAGLKDELDEALAALRRGNRVPPRIAYDAALYGSGLGDDASVAALFAGLVNHPRLGGAARYHYARTLEHMGRYAEAEAQFVRVVAEDRSPTHWYKLLSEQRLWSVRDAMLGCTGPANDDCADDAGERTAEVTTPYGGMFMASLDSLPDPNAGLKPAPHLEGTRAPRDVTVASPDPPDLEQLAARLAPIAAANEEAYPYLGRALDLLHLGEATAASDELHEAFLAWREARGRPLRHTGLEAVYRGEERPRHLVPFRLRARRRGLDDPSRQMLADISAALGDEGTAAGFAGWDRVRSHPRAYEEVVDRAARRYGLDPNLLLAVMRVESVYQHRIVSYAGAVGLMQIMPRTGRLIARALGRDGFTTADLLDPETNIEFAAWYLASLIERFDGRLPLAIASYNGGPHNVRRWMRDHGENVPLDAFLEHIPFAQTYRYVRRVLSHYAAYRAQQNLPMERLGLDLPEVGPDSVAF